MGRVRFSIHAALPPPRPRALIMTAPGRFALVCDLPGRANARRPLGGVPAAVPPRRICADPPR
jgi:hypothetical protein